MSYAFAGLDKVDPVLAREVWNQHAPEGFKFKG
jgi:hypothetical protein